MSEHNKNTYLKIEVLKTCTGCSACYSVCPVDAINMKVDNEGFYKPAVDNSICIECKKCDKTCPIINNFKKNFPNTFEPKTYAVYIRDKEILKKCSSGGVYPLIAQNVIKKGGLVSGVYMDDNFHVQHTLVDNCTDLIKTYGSKYVPSDLKDNFKEIHTALKNGKEVLFTGTPCQVGGLRAYLKKDYSNLITVDLICHGIPSKKLFEKYISNTGRFRKKLTGISFRDKSLGWEKYFIRKEYGKKKKYTFTVCDTFMNLFLCDISLGPGCYNCQFNGVPRSADITIGDYWGIRNTTPNMYNFMGSSAVIINSQKGWVFMDRHWENFIYQEDSLENVIKGNPSLIHSANLHPERENFFVDMDTLSYRALHRKYIKKNTKKWLFNTLRGCKASLQRVMKKEV